MAGLPVNEYIPAADFYSVAYTNEERNEVARNSTQFTWFSDQQSPNQSMAYFTVAQGSDRSAQTFGRQPPFDPEVLLTTFGFVGTSSLNATDYVTGYNTLNIGRQSAIFEARLVIYTATQYK